MSSSVPRTFLACSSDVRSLISNVRTVREFHAQAWKEEEEEKEEEGEEKERETIENVARKVEWQKKMAERMKKAARKVTKLTKAFKTYRYLVSVYSLRFLRCYT